MEVVVVMVEVGLRCEGRVWGRRGRLVTRPLEMSLNKHNLDLLNELNSTYQLD